MNSSRRFILFWTIVLVFFVFSARSISDAHAKSAPRQQIGYKQTNLQPSDVAAFDRFGYSVDISSTFAVIGSPSHDVWDGTNLYTSAGAAYVYQRIGGIWRLNAKLTAPDPQAYANFGISVSIDKNTVVIGAVGYDSSVTIDIGAIYISSYADGTWHPLQRLESGGNEESENFGSALHLEGNILVVGASTSDQSGLIDSGAAYVFIGSSGNWFKQAMLTAGIPQTNSGFGHSVYTDGTRIIVGSPQEDNSGRAYIYKKSSVGWQPIGFLSPGDGRDGDFFGSAVAIDDNRAAVGASSKDTHTDSGRVVNGGGVYVYKQVGPNWNQESLIELEETEVFDSFGNSLDIHNRTLIVGAKGKDYFAAVSSGVAYIYERSGSIWSQRAILFPELAKSHDYFGQAVRTNGEEFLIGAIGRDPKNLSNAGEAFIFDFDKLLPETGFAPNSATIVVNEPSTNSYAETAITLAIPKIKVELSVVGVPSSAFGWDTRWLDNQVGYLETTAFPTLPGNTVLTGHVWDANNTPGPFADLHQLQFGDQIKISAWGLTYTYEVRSSTLVNPDYLTVLEDRELDWITLLTCENFDESSNSYLHRRAVQAVLVSVK